MEMTITVSDSLISLLFSLIALLVSAICFKVVKYVFCCVEILYCGTNINLDVYMVENLRSFGDNFLCCNLHLGSTACLLKTMVLPRLEVAHSLVMHLISMYNVLKSNCCW